MSTKTNTVKPFLKTTQKIRLQDHLWEDRKLHINVASEFRSLWSWPWVVLMPRLHCGVYIPIAPLTVPNNTDPCVGVMPSPGCCMTKEPGINKNVHQITDNLIVAV